MHVNRQDDGMQSASPSPGIGRCSRHQPHVLRRSGRQHGTTCRASLFDDIDRDMDAMMRNMEAQMQQAEAQMNALTRSAQGQNAHHSSRSSSRASDGWQSRSEESWTCSSSQNFHSYRYQSTISYGPFGHPQAVYHAHPPALAGGLGTGLVLGAALLLGAYASVAAAFVAGIQATNIGLGIKAARFRQDKRWQLAFLWPFLAIFSSRFREEFKRALRPSDQISKAKSGSAVSS